MCILCVMKAVAEAVEENQIYDLPEEPTVDNQDLVAEKELSESEKANIKGAILNMVSVGNHIADPVQLAKDLRKAFILVNEGP